MLGYGFSTIVKPFMYIVTTWGAALVQIYSGLIYSGPQLVAECIEATNT